MFCHKSRPIISLAVMPLLLALQAGLAFAQTADDKTWCSRCFIFNGEDVVSSSAFDMKFTNNCGVPIDFRYWRKDGTRHSVLVQPGPHTERCNGSRQEICTEITGSEWECPTKHQSGPQRTSTSPKPAGADSSDLSRRLEAAKKK